MQGMLQELLDTLHILLRDFQPFDRLVILVTSHVKFFDILLPLALSVIVFVLDLVGLCK